MLVKLSKSWGSPRSWLRYVYAYVHLIMSRSFMPQYQLITITLSDHSVVYHVAISLLLNDNGFNMMGRSL